MSIELDEAMTQLTSALEQLASVELGDTGSSELEAAVVGIEAARTRLDALQAPILDRWRLFGGWRATGAKSAAARLAHLRRWPIADARRLLRHAKLAVSFPLIGDAWRDGQIDRAHVAALAQVRTPRTRWCFERDQTLLLDAARTLPFPDFKHVIDVWEVAADPDGAEGNAEQGRAARELHLTQLPDGSWRLTATLDPISGQIVKDTLDPVDQELFEADWKDAATALGRRPLVIELGRTPRQRRHDAIVEICTRARTAPPGGRRPEPLFNVHLGNEALQLVVELHNRTVLTPGTVARWLDRSVIERIVWDGRGRVIEIGERRCFSDAQRRALIVQDRTCFFPGCDDPPLRPEADHVVEASKGGRTTLANGRLACRFHNNWRNTHPEGPDPP